MRIALLSKEEYKEGSVKSYIEDLVGSLRNLFSSSTKVTIDTRIEDFNLSSKTLFALGIIVNELITNAMKYAFDEKSGGSIQVFLLKKESHVRLTIQDNGRGLPEDFALEEAKGFGLTLVKMLCQQVGGSYLIENREETGGTKSILKFKVKKSSA